MKKFSKILSFVAVMASLLVSCSKIDNLHKSDPLPVYELGKSPVLAISANSVTPTLATAADSIVAFTWTDPEYANDHTTTKYVLEIDTVGGSFTLPASVTVNGVLTTSLTGEALNTILLNYGARVGVAKNLTIRLISSYANNNERYMSNTVSLSAAPFAEPSVLSGSVSSATLALDHAADNAINFSWTASFPGYTGGTTYALEYDSAGKNFAVPLELPLSPATVLSRSVIQGDLNQAAINAGIAGGTAGQLEFRIKATTAAGDIVYSNVFLLSVNTYFPIRRFYMPGGYQSGTGNGNDWDPPTAPELIRDQRSAVLNNMYYIYIYIPAGQEFKFTQGRSWDINYGGSGGDLVPGGANLTVPTSGFYRITIDLANMKYDIRDGRMGFVGDATGAGWNPPGVFPNYALGNSGTNLFVGVTDFTPGGWKLIDNNEWNNGSNAANETRSYGSSGGDGSSLVTNADNFPNITTAGRNRVIWDGRDRDNVKYFMSAASEMRIVGDGIQGVPAWDPGNSPQMTYIGNNQWQITTTLIGGKDIKFLAGNAWGAFDYEDNSGGNTETGVARPIKWEGGDNFKTPLTTGTYTITLDEGAQTVTIN